MRAIPTAPLVLGLAGLIPFWVLAIALAMHGAFGLDAAGIDRALATYAAIIVSFLGGIRWGLAAARGGENDAHFAISVAPSLIAWALMVAPEPLRLCGLGLLALLLGPIDARLIGDGLAPAWLGRLRLILSSGAGVALLLGAVGAR